MGETGPTLHAAWCRRPISSLGGIDIPRVAASSVADRRFQERKSHRRPFPSRCREERHSLRSQPSSRVAPSSEAPWRAASPSPPAAAPGRDVPGRGPDVLSSQIHPWARVACLRHRPGGGCLHESSQEPDGTVFDGIVGGAPGAAGSATGAGGSATGSGGSASGVGGSGIMAGSGAGASVSGKWRDGWGCGRWSGPRRNAGN